MTNSDDASDAVTDSGKVAGKRSRTPHAESIRAATKYLRGFVTSHGTAQYTIVEKISVTATRIVIVGGDGRFGDVVLPTVDAANAAVTEAGLTATDGWDRESSSSVVTTDYEWHRMGANRFTSAPG